MNHQTMITIALLLFLGCTKKDTTPNTNNVTNTTVNNAKWLKTKVYIQYAEDGVTEAYKSETFYDSEGRPTWVNSYTNGVLSGQGRNYVYNGDECTYTSASYSAGVETGTRKIKVIYKND